MNNTKERSLLVFGLLTIFSVPCFSQSKDNLLKEKRDTLNISKKAVAYAADKFTIVRPLNIEFAHAAPYKFTSEKGPNSIPESKVNRFTQAEISTNFSFIKRKTWLLGVAAGYRYASLEADLTLPALGGIKTVDEDYHYLFSAVNFTYFSKLFNKRTIYTSSVLVDGSDQHFERVKGLLTGTIVLKANERTKLMVGMVVNIDPSAQTPFIPTFSYEHKFNNGLIADIVLPKSAYLRKYVLTNGRISLGTELNGTSFYVYNIDGTAQRYEYRQLDINSGLMYEHIVANYFVVTAKTGMKWTTSGRLFRKEDSFGDPVFQISPDPTFYVNIGISFNPLSFLGKKN
jgi:hypothetical protein